MSRVPRVLVVDDQPQNVKLLRQVLLASGYEVTTALSGADGLASLAAEPPDLVLLDVMMPGMSGYEVCRAIRAQAETALLPVVLVTALDPSEERLKGIEAGADDFISKPINQAELLARVRSLLRIRTLHVQVQEQAQQLAAWNMQLERRVAEQVEQLERLARLKRFLSPKVADLIVAGHLDDPLATRRREVTILFADLRGFTAFSEATAPEDVMAVLRDYHAAIGELASLHEATIEHFAGDGVMLVFNDPAPLPDPAFSAVSMALGLRDRVGELAVGWRRMGYQLGAGFGIAQGYATIGTIGFPGRQDYGTVGVVNNLAARLCSEAKPGEVLVSQRVISHVEGRVAYEDLGGLALKGFQSAVPAYRVTALRAAEELTRSP